MSIVLERPESTPKVHRPPRGARSARRLSNGRAKLLATTIAGLLLASGVFAAVHFRNTGNGRKPDYVLHEVKRQELDLLVVERGNLESGKNVDVVCEVEARNQQAPATTILWIIPEGSAVKKGDLLVELDSASLKDQITTQEIKVEQARALFAKAETDLDITRSQNESDMDAAEIAVKLTDIDLRKYLEGDYLQERRGIDGEIVIAEEELKRAEQRLAYSERLAKKGYVSSSEVEADRLAVTKTKTAVDVAREKLRVLDEYTKPRTVTDLTSQRDEARRVLGRVRNQSKAKVAQAEAARLAQKLTSEKEETTLRKLQEQLAKCKLTAPIDGMVVYANDPSSSGRGLGQLQIEEGAAVRERQKLIHIPDLHSVLVNVKVHEAKIGHVRPGQPARIEVESMPDKSFHGTVLKVATTADPQSWFSAGVQLYTVMVSMDEPVDGLKPGMTAEVEITAGKLPNVIAVPVQAVVERAGQSYCYVIAPNQKTPELRHVELGPSNDKMIAIQKGVSEDELVVENLASVINEAKLERVAKEDAARNGTAGP